MPKGGIPAQYKALTKRVADLSAKVDGLRDYVDEEIGEHDDELEQMRDRLAQIEQVLLAMVGRTP